MQEQVFHILITKECTHKCPLCCNRLYDLDNLPTVTGEMLRTAHTVCLTGGEPFLLDSVELIDLCKGIRKQYPNIQKLYIYTSGTGFAGFTKSQWIQLFQYIDGINIAPKNRYEWAVLMQQFQMNNYWFELTSHPAFSNRLYLFEDQLENWEFFKLRMQIPDTWQVIGRKWDAEFKTPENEHFVRLPILF